MKICQDKKPLASYGINESHLSFVALLDQFKFSGDLWVIELLDFQDIIQPPIKLHGHYVATTTYMILHTHAVVLHKSLNVLLQNPKKNQMLCSASKELNLHQASFWDNGNYLLVADFYSLYGNNFLFSEKFNKNLYQHLAKPTTTQALHKAW